MTDKTNKAGGKPTIAQAYRDGQVRALSQAEAPRYTIEAMPNLNGLEFPALSGGNDANALFDGFKKVVAEPAGAYLKRRGVSTGTAEDGLGISVKIALDGLDRADGKEDGIIARETLVHGHKMLQHIKGQAEKEVAAERGKLGVPLFDGTNFNKAEINLMKAGLAISQLPEHFSIRNEAQDAAVAKAVATLDANRDGRIMPNETQSRKIEDVLGQLAQDLVKSAISVAAPTAGPQVNAPTTTPDLSPLRSQRRSIN